MDAVPLPDGEPAGPEPLTEDEVARYVVAAAVWAPSVHNTQPWRFTARRQQVSLCGDAERQLRVADPDGRESAQVKMIRRLRRGRRTLRR